MAEIKHPRAAAIIVERLRIIKGWQRDVSLVAARAITDEKSPDAAAFARDLERFGDVLSVIVPMMRSILPPDARSP